MLYYFNIVIKTIKKYCAIYRFLSKKYPVLSFWFTNIYVVTFLIVIYDSSIYFITVFVIFSISVLTIVYPLYFDKDFALRHPFFF